ncbi:general substrate transporter [Exophiala viscosa]|uniref:General substrate transporter n=1 Tax=Exophiala viscosa TaxID=2486360 RepID=A0AAN6I8Q6_9EURO|nr:general substrate transporter [Exophiala viscosa]KAI1620376.1 general substrate transporter [Exophiala viscosa]
MRNWYRHGRPLRAAIGTCCLAAFLFFGFDQGVFSGILQNENWLNQFHHPNDTKTGILVSCYCLGALCGCGLNFFIGDYFGRRKMMWLAMSFVIVGASLQCSAYTVPHLVIGRIITGFGTGIDSSTVPMYQSELCRKEWRGRLVSWEVLFIGVGISFAYWLDFGMSYAGGEIAWRLPIAVQLLFAITVIILLFGLPESPRWLFKKGRDEEAIHVLCAVFDLPPTDPYITSEVANIKHALRVEAGVTSHMALFKKDKLKTRRRIILAYFGLFMNQMVGINLVVYYMPTVLIDTVKLTPRVAQIIAGFIQLMFIVGNIGPALALDRMGRRKTMLYGAFGLGCCMMMASILLSFGKPHTSAAAVAFFFIYMIIFGGSINVVPWVYGPEILPLQARSRGTAISVAAHWTWNFFVVMITPVLINRLGWKTYLIFMALAFSFVPVIYFFYPETSNISLEDIDRIFLKDGEMASERSSTVGDDESMDMRVRNEQTEKLGEKHAEGV